MNILKYLFDKFFPSQISRPKQGISELQVAFKKQYRNFRSLLTANNNVLEIMAEMEQTLAMGQPFSMSFIRGRITALTTNVYKIIQYLSQLSNGKYSGLTSVFNDLTTQLENILMQQPAVPKGKFIMPFAEIDRDSVDLTGEKMANLGEVRNHAKLKVPDGFAITSSAAHHFIAANNLEDEINRRLQTMAPDNLESVYQTSAAIQQLISRAPLPADIEEAILAEYAELESRQGDHVLVSIRSSATGEDSITSSFAGQYRTQLNVDKEFLIQTYKEIVASKYRSQAIIYRLQRGYRTQDVSMCVGCLAMVDAVVSGVIYSRSPENPRSKWVVIHAAPGLAVQVVDGSAPTNMYSVSREEPHKVLDSKISCPDTTQSSTGEQVSSLSSDQIIELTRIALRLENHFGAPQDIEWSINRSGAIIILQSRPLGLLSLDVRFPEHEKNESEESTPCLMSGGTVVSAGVACGPVHIVRSNIDLLQFPEGAVLVVAHPFPEWASLLNRACAVVSETGQVAAHLATVAREFQLPAIFGMEKATEVLKRGDIITVDAVGRRIYSGREESILTQATPSPNLMKNSPVYRLLQEALTLITPLNLTDPASPFFKPSSCETFHDITRFCHEKAVIEMFQFGKRHSFDEKAAKQLVGKTPFQWWVIDLDGGFREGLDSKNKFIHIDDIVSTPMRAIWHGITAIPWQGPPPVSLKGFGSIIFQSTMNPNLDPAVRSTLTAKNYFLVSKNFCNLSVRLGYHFALVETYLSDFLTESYVSFQFKGGAADETRKLIRITLLKDILERFDFRVELKADALTARIEKKPTPFLLERLQVLGYLLIHTRQIDMVMEDQGMLQHYRQKILADIDMLLKTEIKQDDQGATVNGAGL